ncbi:hypothetical protein GCM10028805_56920 [Spirosoma harenae]
MRYLLFIAGLSVLWGCSSKKESSQASAPDSVVASPQAEVPAGAGSGVEKQPITNGKGDVAGSESWAYTKTTDKEGRTVYKASINSPNLLEFDFPYNGGAIATLTIRKREDDTHLYIQISKGQFNRSYQEGQARVRFDKSPPAMYMFSAAENGSANIIFFNSEQELIKKMKAAKNMIIDVDFAGQGSRQIEFRTAGLEWNH